MSKMTIEQAHVKKQELESTMLSLIRKFEEETGLVVDHIYTDKVSRNCGQEVTASLRAAVKLQYHIF